MDRKEEIEWINERREPIEASVHAYADLMEVLPDIKDRLELRRRVLDGEDEATVLKELKSRDSADHL